MLCKCYSAACIGLDVVPVTVEVSVTQGVGFHLVGLPDSAVKESISRVAAALLSTGYKIPGKKIIINMAPADLKKEGSAFDLVIAVGLLAASEQISASTLDKTLLVGELSLDGCLRNVQGVLPISIRASSLGFERCIFPKGSAGEAAEVDGISVYSAGNLPEVLDILRNEEYIGELLVKKRFERTDDAPQMEIMDFEDVIGQEAARRGLEIAACGSHNILLTGPPGAGKSFMARCLSGILPPMSREESLQTSMILSVAGLLDGDRGLLTRRPFRSPHHTSSLASLVGGGRDAAPGEISLAHNGVLYLDEMNLFPSSVLDVLRQPLEERVISISRVRYKVKYPASFMLVGSMNPCPCGYYGFDDDSDHGHRCTCSPGIIMRYRSRISGPMMDRIDLNIRVKAVDSSKLVRGVKGESSASIASRVEEVRKIQLDRFRKEGIFTNSQMNARHIRKFCIMSSEALALCDRIMKKYNLSARGYSRILKVARTLADMSHSDKIGTEHLLEAVQYRISF